MSALKDSSAKLTLNGQELSLMFDLNVLDEVQDRFGSYDKIDENINPEKNNEWVKNLRWLLTLLINEGLPEDAPMFTEMQVGRMVHAGNMAQIRTAIFTAFVNGGEGDATQEDITEGNQTGAQE